MIFYLTVKATLLMLISSACNQLLSFILFVELYKASCCPRVGILCILFATGETMAWG